MTPISLCERLTFDKLFRMSEPKRIDRSFSVKGPPLEIDSYQDVVYYAFNFKSNPSTTGLRHKGYVKFFKPRNPKSKPLQHLECLVDCTCPDYRYRWAWTNKQRGSGVVGPNSLNQAWNKAPRRTNPAGHSGLCKHILAARSYIYWLLSEFTGDEPDTAEKLNKLTKYAKKRWTDFPGAMAAAKERDKEMARIRALRNISGRLPEPEPEEPAGVDARTDAPDDQQPKATTDFKAAKPPPLPPKAKQPAKAPAAPAAPLAVPPGNRGRGFPMKPKPPKPNAGYHSKAEYDFYRRQGLGDSLALELENPVMERVVNANNGKNMSDLKQAIKLVQEMEDDILDRGAESPEAMGDMGDMSAPEAEPLEPSEPPVSDAAIGADTEGDTALGLLQQMKELLTQIAMAVAPAEGAEGEAGMEGEMPPGLEGAMPPEPPSDEEIPSEEAPEGHEEDEDDEFEEVEEGTPNRRPSQ